MCMNCKRLDLSATFQPPSGLFDWSLEPTCVRILWCVEGGLHLGCVGRRGRGGGPRFSVLLSSNRCNCSCSYSYSYSYGNNDNDNGHSFSQLSAHKALTCPGLGPPDWRKNLLHVEIMRLGLAAQTSYHFECSGPVSVLENRWNTDCRFAGSLVVVGLLERMSSVLSLRQLRQPTTSTTSARRTKSAKSTAKTAPTTTITTTTNRHYDDRSVLPPSMSVETVMSE